MPKLSNPLPQPLAKECAKAAKIFKSFVDSGNNGLDGVIPRSVLEQAKGFAVFTIVKAGFIFSARAGSGIVIAKLDDGSWSAPSAIGTAGVGFGGQAGAEMTDFLVVLNSRSAVRSFMASGSLTFGGNLSIALGPLGRNGEASGSLNTNGRMAAMYSYSKTRGLFGGVSLEGSVIVERQDANAQAYDSPVTAKMLLGGMVDPPDWARPLIKTLEMCTGMPNGRPWINDLSNHGRQYSFDGLGSGGVSPSSGTVPSRTPSRTPSFLRKKKKPSEFPPASWGSPSDSGSYFSAQPSRERSVSDFGTNNTARSGFDTQFNSDYDSAPAYAHSARLHEDSIPSLSEDPLVKAIERNMHSRSASLFMKPSRRDYTGVSTANTDPDFMGFSNARDPIDDPFSSRPASSLGGRRYTMMIQPKPELTQPLRGGIGRAIALYPFNGQEAGDLSFAKGDVITIMKKSDSIDDWWTGRLNGREGIFPANFVEVV